jgi:hypothetical protein
MAAAKLMLDAAFRAALLIASGFVGHVLRPRSTFLSAVLANLR